LEGVEINTITTLPADLGIVVELHL
jgi:hypothetical protein